MTNENLFAHVLRIYSVNKKVSASPRVDKGRPHIAAWTSPLLGREAEDGGAERETGKALGGQGLKTGQQGEKPHQICMLFYFGILANSPNVHTRTLPAKAGREITLLSNDST